MNTFTKIVVLLSLLFLIVFAGLTVYTIAGMNGEVFRDLDYKTDPSGVVYQIVYPVPRGTRYYGRMHTCTTPKSCASAWMPPCKKRKALIAEGHWPLHRAGKLTRASEEVPVYRYGPVTGPTVLVVQTSPCLLEYPLAGSSG